MALKIGTNGAENFSRFGKGGKKVIPLIPQKVLPFIRKISTGMKPFHLNSHRNYRVFRTNGKRS